MKAGERTSCRLLGSFQAVFPGWGWARVGHAVAEHVGDAMGEGSANEIVMKNKGNPIIPVYADEVASALFKKMCCSRNRARCREIPSYTGIYR